MATTTTRMLLPYPQSTDNNNTPLYMGNLAQDIDDKLANKGTLATRGGLTARQGMRFWTTDGGGAACATESFYDGAAWLNISRYSQGTLAARPAANTVLPGHLYFATDAVVLYVSDAANWIRTGPAAGVIYDFGGLEASIPAGYIALKGDAISRTGANADLFAAWGTLHGAGDGSTTFGTPDSRGMVMAGKDTIGGSQTPTTAYRIGNTEGSKQGEITHLLTTAEMPIHNHTVSDPGHGHAYNTDQTGSGTTASVARAGNTTTSAFNTTYNQDTGISIGNRGSGTPHNIVQPTMIVMKMAKL